MKTIELYDDNDEEYLVEVPTRWEICDCCHGEGHRSNPAIDGNGITQSEWDEWDYEEREAYMEGRYDISCDNCGGSGKIEVIDKAAFKKENPEDFRRWEKSEKEEAEYRQMADSEARWENKMLYGSDY